MFGKWHVLVLRTEVAMNKHLQCSFFAKIKSTLNFGQNLRCKNNLESKVKLTCDRYSGDFNLKKKNLKKFMVQQTRS